MNPENRTITDVSLSSGDIMKAFGRGRTTLFLPLRTNPRKKVRRPDVLVLGANTDGDHHYALQIDARRMFKFRKLRGLNETTVGFRKVKNSHAVVTDVDNDGTLEIVSFKTFSIWRLVRDFTLEDVTASLLPSRPGAAGNRYVGTAGVAELDYDNDGWWDLFLTRSPTAQLYWVKKRPIHDALLHNVNGRGYEDVTGMTGVPIGNITYSRGVTTGDFDNDGYVDIVLCDYRPNATRPYIFLHNVASPDGSGRRVFNARYDIPGLRTRGNGRVNKGERLKKNAGYGINGDGVTAVDYDLDGLVDLILSEGDWFDETRGGRYRVLRNVWRGKGNNRNGYLLVRVKNGPRRRASSMHAVVRVRTDNGLTMMRRVGSPGTMVSNSLVETVHFGVGKAERVLNVSVTWVDGSVRYMENVEINQRISFGVL